MTRLRVDLAYDGAPFYGWARQHDVPTVQADVEFALGRILDQPVETTCAGRTDRGVHALAQVVSFDVAPTSAAQRALADLDTLGERLQQLTSPAITIWRVREVAPTFDARRSATARRYRYRIWNGRVRPPLRRHDTWHIAEPLHLLSMRAASRALLGEHDFGSFCRRREGATTVRRLDRVSIARRGDEVHVVLLGPAFCHQQVRSIVAALVQVGLGQRPASWMADLLAARDRVGAPPVAPPQGLTLEAVSYGRSAPAAPPSRTSARGNT